MNNKYITVERAPMVQSVKLTGPVTRLNGNAQKDLVVDIDPKLAQQIGPHGIPVGSPGHCVAITPLINAKEANNVDNIAGKGVAIVSNLLLRVVDSSLNFLFDSAEAVDGVIFKNGIDNFNGINNIESPHLQAAARWTERGLGLSLGLGAYHYAKSRYSKAPALALNPGMAASAGVAPNHLAVAAREVKGFWGRRWPIASVIFLAATGVAAEAGKGVDAIDPDHSLFTGDSRKYARWAGYGAMFLGSMIALNLPTKDGYRKIVAPAVPPAGAKPMNLPAGFAWATFYYVLGNYWTNWSIQTRVQTTALNGNQSVASMYNPMNWDNDYSQVQTEASHAAVWGLSGYMWAALHSGQTKVTNTISKKLFGFGSEVLAMQPAEQAFIDSGKYAISRGFRGVYMRLFTGKRALFTITSAFAGLPMGVGIGQLIERASKYESTAARSGTPFRALITGPAGTAGMTFVTASRGYVRAWESYAFNMIPINWTWSACSKMGENLYQSARVMAEDYKNSSDEAERRTLRTKMFKTYITAYDDGDPKSDSSEKARIKKVMEEAGIDVRTITDNLFAN